MHPPGALLSSDDFGSSVERMAKLHPLWQAFCSQREQRALAAASEELDGGGTARWPGTAGVMVPRGLEHDG